MAFVVPLGTRVPDIDPSVFLAPNASVIGAVRIGARSSIWYGAVLRGDSEQISFGSDSNLQDLSVVHVDPGHPVVVGDRVTIGHGVVLHGARVEDDVLIGMGSILMNGVVIGRGSLVGAGSLLTSGTVVPPDSLVVGAPARVLRPVRPEEAELIAHGATNYLELAATHRTSLEQG